jgi:hypothetical protein
VMLAQNSRNWRNKIPLDTTRKRLQAMELAGSNSCGLFGQLPDMFTGLHRLRQGDLINSRSLPQCEKLLSLLRVCCLLLLLPKPVIILGTIIGIII